MTMVRLGITGGIGSGKSYVCRKLAEHFDIPIYNCDIHARIITLTDADVAEQLSCLIPGVFDAEGELDKKRMADYLFASEENARRVNQIIHPAVRRDLHEWFRSHDVPLVAVESAILYESGFDDEVDSVLLVDAPLELRIQRTMERDGLTHEQVIQRINRQQTEQARQRADFIILNDGIAPLESQLSEILQSIMFNS